MGQGPPDSFTYKALGDVVPMQTSIFVYFILSDPSAPTQIMAPSFFPTLCSFLSFPVGSGRHSLAWEHCHVLPPGS